MTDCGQVIARPIELGKRAQRKVSAISVQE